jgi:hypothetical protein
MLRARERAPNCLLFRCFNFIFTFKSIKELGSESNALLHFVFYKNTITKKKRYDDFGMEIQNILNTNSTRFARISKEHKEGYNEHYF